MVQIRLASFKYEACLFIGPFPCATALCLQPSKIFPFQSVPVDMLPAYTDIAEPGLDWCAVVIYTLK